MVVEHVPIGQVKPYPGNPRKNKAAVQKVAASIKEFGWRQPIVLDKDFVVIAGHTRLLAAEHLGLYVVPVHVAKGLTAEQVAAYRLADNRVGEESAWDSEKLAVEIAALVGAGYDPQLAGFDRDELDALLQVAAGIAAADGSEGELEDGPQKDPVSRVGDLWTLGAHRAMCGDSTSQKDVARLMGGEKAHLVNTDPPYGVDVIGRGETAKLGGIKNDTRTEDKLTDLLTPAFKMAVQYAEDDAAFYIWHASSSRRDTQFSMDAAAIEEKQAITWVKDNFVMGRADYHWQTEPCFYGQKRGQKAQYFGGRDQSTSWRFDLVRSDGTRAVALDNGIHVTDGQGNSFYVFQRAPKGKKIRHMRLTAGQALVIGDAGSASDCWQVARDGDSYQHPTQKPSALAIRAIENNTLAGQIVLDLFAGGGFTLLGAEATGRRARVMELDPRFVDVIVSRWVRATKEKATCVRADGTTLTWGDEPKETAA
jgi:DNA modification methylase